MYFSTNCLIKNKDSIVDLTVNKMIIVKFSEIKSHKKKCFFKPEFFKNVWEFMSLNLNFLIDYC